MFFPLTFETYSIVKFEYRLVKKSFSHPLDFFLKFSNVWYDLPSGSNFLRDCHVTLWALFSLLVVKFLS